MCVKLVLLLLQPTLICPSSSLPLHFVARCKNFVVECFLILFKAASKIFFVIFYTYTSFLTTKVAMKNFSHSCNAFFDTSEHKRVKLSFLSNNCYICSNCTTAFLGYIRIKTVIFLCHLCDKFKNVSVLSKAKTITFAAATLKSLILFFLMCRECAFLKGSRCSRNKF